MKEEAAMTNVCGRPLTRDAIAQVMAAYATTEIRQEPA
jgi:hypothetical protein